MSGLLVALAAMAAGFGVAPTAEAGWSRPALIADDQTAGPLLSSARSHATVGWLDRGGRIRLRRIGADGRLTRTVKVSGAVDDQAWGPKTAEAADGAVTAVWFERSGGARSVIRARRVASNGAVGPIRTIAPQHTVSSTVAMAMAGGGDVEVAVDRGGNAFVVWAQVEGEALYRDFDVTSTTIHARRLDRTGRLGPVLDLAVSDDRATEPDVAVAAAGGATVVWASRTAGSSTVHAAGIGRDGLVRRTRTLARTAATTEVPGRPEITSNGRGHAIVLWEADSGVPVVACRLMINGDPSPVRVVASETSAISGVQAVVDTAGRATIVWRRDRSADDLRNQLVFRRLSRDGAAGPVRGLSGTVDRAWSPALAVDRQGAVTAVWTGPSEARPAVHARRIAPNGRLGRTQTLTKRTSDLLATLAVTVDGSGVTTVAWWRLIRRGSLYRYIQAARLVPR
jgi:hypothetical protein